MEVVEEEAWAVATVAVVGGNGEGDVSVCECCV